LSANSCLVSSFEKNKTDTTLYADLAEPIAVFKKWDYYANEFGSYNFG
jgi:hypothetical protein